MKQQRNAWKWVVCALAAAAAVTGISVIIAHAVKQSKSRSHAATAGPEVDWGSSAAAARELVQLPPPGSPAAEVLLAGRDTPTWMSGLYAYHRDSANITPELTTEWLQLLQQQLQEHGVTLDNSSAAGSSSNPRATAGKQQELDLQPFIRVAADVLAYLRFSRSVALLTLLREFASSSAITVDAVDPDVLQAEVQQLFDLQNLSSFYVVMARVDSTHDAAESAVASLAMSKGAAELRGRMLRHSSQKQQQRWQQQRSLLLLDETEQSSAEQAALTDQLLSQMTGGGAASSSSSQPGFMGAGNSSSSSSSSSGGVSSSGGLQRAAARTLTPPTGAVSSMPAAGRTNSSSSTGVQSLLDMVCAAAPWAPPGSLGDVLPAGTTCPVAAPVDVFTGNALGFKPVTVPVVFHVLRFLVDVPALGYKSTDIPQVPLGGRASTAALPPIWDTSSSSSSSSSSSGAAAGHNLVDAANRIFTGSGVQFALRDVRTDVAKYPYLLQRDKSAWLGCSHNAASTAEGLACLQGIAKDPAVAALATQEHVINVLISGSDGRTDYTYCSATAADPKPPCRTTSRGYTAARGPWFLGSADPTWSEDVSEANWVFLSWSHFDTASLNKGPWNGGGATLAHELGHYLGLLHTHQGCPACLNGPDTGDGVTDTPPNQDLESYAGGTEAARLAGWCSDFRNGKGPASDALSDLQSCPGFQDNVFNTMSYVPDQCCMLFSPGQVQRMQWAIAAYRPQMMAAYASAG